MGFAATRNVRLVTATAVLVALGLLHQGHAEDDGDFETVPRTQDEQGMRGSSGDFYRYKHIVKIPTDDDRDEALRMSEGLRCKACEVILDTLVKRSESNSEDHIMDQLDGELEKPPEVTENPQVNLVNKNRRGCNKHFKDELLLKGWAVAQCPDDSGASATGTKPCLKQDLSGMPDEDEVDTWSVAHEAIFHSCEKTVGQYGSELASAISEGISDGRNRAVLLAEVCREVAQCEGRKPKSRRRRRRRSTGGGGGEL